MIWLFLFICFESLRADSMSSRLNNCGSSQGCWLMPPGCEQSNGPNCMGILSWMVSPNSIQFSLITYVSDLLDNYIIQKSIYGAVGFSLDPHMGDDSVFVCVINSTGQGAVFINWNDGHSSERVYEASEMMISNARVSLIADRMNCEFQWVFRGLELLPSNEKSRVFNLSDPKLETYIMFARGSADPHTYEINSHSLSDGLLFPFVTTDVTSFCSSGCGQTESHEWMIQMHQAIIPQNTKQKMVVIHSTLMLLTFLVLFPSAIMASRFGKKHLQRIFGMFVWLNIHIVGGIKGFLCMIIACIAIYYQAGFSFIKCSTKCNGNSFLRYLHALIGTFLFGIICLLFLISMFVPKVTSNRRMLWNFFHIFVGYAIWIVGCVSCFVGVSLTKTSLTKYYDCWPQQIMAIGVSITLVCFIASEWIVHQERFVSINVDAVEKLYNAETRSANEEAENEESASNIPWILIAFNAICGIVITSTICIMVLNAARKNGFDM